MTSEESLEQVRAFETINSCLSQVLELESLKLLQYHRQRKYDTYCIITLPSGNEMELPFTPVSKPSMVKTYVGVFTKSLNYQAKKRGINMRAKAYFKKRKV